MAAEPDDRDDCGPPGESKKSLTPALLGLAEGRGTLEPRLTAIWMARQINEELGGAFVTPWDVGELPWEWIDAILAKRLTMPKLAEGKAQVAAYATAWRKRVSRRH